MDLPEGFHKEVIEARESNTNNVSHINDLVSTEPLNPGGASFKTNVLIKASPSKYIYKPYIGVALFCFMFFALGLGLLFFAFFPFSGDSINASWAIIAVGLIFMLVASFMFYSFYKPRVFDKQLGLYYSTYNFKLYSSNRKNSNDYIKLNRIEALQIIGEHVKSDNGSYKSFELNLVLDDNSRKNVIDHGNLKSIIDDAHTLSEFLNVPIWHAKSSSVVF
ncbi:hypothetical protein [uncultured Winogradskyella sp.]|uniref:hypothetical protein n=1 Tax=uncultured Winogradskyella sp. TaxID=395353 RepID=UPI00261A9448|nr:hypothetical protein [uncultured Winogradskyella sp.]